MKRFSAYLAAFVMLAFAAPFIAAGYVFEIVVDGFAFGRSWSHADADRIARRF